MSEVLIQGQTQAPMEAPFADGSGGNSERKIGLKIEAIDQARDYFNSLRNNIRYDSNTVEAVYGSENLLHPTSEIADRAERLALEAIDRNNRMADVLSNRTFQEMQDRQRKQRGNCAVGKIICMDGRIATPHTDGPNTGVQEAMGGYIPTAVSKLTGRVELMSQTLDRAIQDRPKQLASQILEVNEAHAKIKYDANGSLIVTSNCVAIEKFQKEAEQRGEPFSSNDLVAENFRLMEPSTDAITRKYNDAAREAGKPELDKVVIRAVFDTESQGLLIGYGEEETPLFTSALLEQMESILIVDLFHDPRLREPGYFRESFTRIDRFIEKEELTTDLIDYFLNSRLFNRNMTEARQRLNELDGLTDEQFQALSSTIAKNMAFQWLTGLHKRALAPTHPFAQHNERYQAITLDDGYGATVGKNDPEIQVFTANTATVPEAIDHIKTKVSLMGSNDAQKPYILFICSGIAEKYTNDPDVRKQARAIVGRTFKAITQNDDVANYVTSGLLVPIPAIVSSRTNRVIDVPNLMC